MFVLSPSFILVMAWEEYLHYSKCAEKRKNRICKLCFGMEEHIDTRIIQGRGKFMIQMAMEDESFRTLNKRQMKNEFAWKQQTNAAEN